MAVRLVIKYKQIKSCGRTPRGYDLQGKYIYKYCVVRLEVQYIYTESGVCTPGGTKQIVNM